MASISGLFMRIFNYIQCRTQKVPAPEAKVEEEAESGGKERRPDVRAALQTYADDARILADSWNSAKEALTILDKAYMENKASVDMLRKNTPAPYDSDEELVGGFAVALEPIEVRLDKELVALNILKEEFQALSDSLARTKEECREIVELALKLYSELTSASSSPSKSEIKTSDKVEAEVEAGAEVEADVVEST
jgi:hypothetical protein